MTDLTPYKLGLKPPRPGAVAMKFKDYARYSLPTPPAEFGREMLVSPFHLLGNDKYGDCFWVGAASETYIWTAEAGARARITTVDVLSDYRSTGFDPDKPETDCGTDMQQGASYRRKTGIRDAIGRRHTIGAYTQIQAGHVDELKQATWLFGAVGLGVQVGDRQQEQFSRGVPWDGPTGPNAGGHYIVCCGYRNGRFKCVSWGKLIDVTEAFVTAHNDQTLCYLSADFLTGGKSLDGLDMPSLLDDLNQLTKG